jgi:cell division protein FtsW
MLASIKMRFWEYLRFASPILTAMCLICAVLFLMDDLGQIICMFLLTFIILIYAGIRPDFATAIFAFIVLALVGLYELGNTDLLTDMPNIVVSALEKYHHRIDGFIHPYASSFQNTAALWEMAAAGWTGSGPMLNQPSRIPYSYAEMVFGATTGYFGLAGGTAIILAFLALMISSWRVSEKSSDLYLKVLTFTSASMLTIEAFFMVAANMSIAPISGMTLGFISVGGTAMLKNGILLGFIIYGSLAGEVKND